MTTHAHLGKAWEVTLDQRHDEYRRDRRALLVHTFPPIRILSRIVNGAFRACWLGTGPVDYFGAVAPRGRAVVFDAKSTEAERWRLSELPRHQASILETAAVVGGLSFVALRFDGVGLGRREFVLPWSELGPRWKAWTSTKRAPAGLASLSIGDCQEIGHEIVTVPGDWLGALQTAGLA